MKKSLKRKIDSSTIQFRSSIPLPLFQAAATAACLSVLLLIGACGVGECENTEPLFTVPFQRSVTQTVWDYTEESVDLYMPRPNSLYAPSDAMVTDAWMSSVTLKHPTENAIIVLEGLDDVWVYNEEELCGGEQIGSTQQVRVSAYWGQEPIKENADLSLVRIVRNSQVTDLSDIRMADQVHSALHVNGETQNKTNVNAQQCIFGD